MFENNFLSGILITGGDGIPPHQKITPISFYTVPCMEFNAKKPETAEPYVPQPYITSFVSGYYIKQYMQFDNINR